MKRERKRPSHASVYTEQNIAALCYKVFTVWSTFIIFIITLAYQKRQQKLGKVLALIEIKLLVFAIIGS
jgi:hypothetical protein